MTRIEVNGEVRPITEEDKQAILATNKDLAKQALRVLMMAYKTSNEIPTLESEIVESDLIFSGLVGMIDPERPEAAEAVRVAKEAGIRPIMITVTAKIQLKLLPNVWESSIQMIQKIMSSLVLS